MYSPLKETIMQIFTLRNYEPWGLQIRFVCYVCLLVRQHPENMVNGESSALLPSVRLSYLLNSLCFSSLFRL